MRDFYPLIFVGAVVAALSVAFIIAYASVKNKKEAMGFDRNVSDAVIIKRLLGYAKKHAWSFVLVLIIMLFSIAYDVISPYFIGQIEKLVTGTFTVKELELRVAAFASVLIVSVVSVYVQAVILQKTGQKIISELREDVFRRIESLSHAQLTKIPVGTLVTRTVYDTNSVSIMFTNILVNLVKNVFMLVGVFTAMVIINPAMTLVVMCFVPFVVLFTVIFRRFSRMAHRMVKDRTTDVNVFLSENLSGIKITQIFNREERKLAEFRERNVALKKAKQRQILVFGIFRPVVYMLYMCSVLVLFFVASLLRVRGAELLGYAIDSSVVVTFYMYLNKFFNPIQNIAEQFHRLQSAFASAEKIFAVLDTEPEITDALGAIELSDVRGDIEFRDVWFEYKPGEPVLKGVSFHILPGQTAAFVGATGAGKSTILSLICRNYDIQKGEILIDGTDIRKIKISSLRRHIGQMLQDVFLFSGTVRSNIALREEGFSDDEINEVCRYVNADAFIEKLKNGLDDEVRERGNNFSAGQRQLLSFARTIIHRPSVMILDEATANIDTETEALIQDSLQKIRTIGTTIVVAHRLSTIRSADVIYLMSGGRIIEQGSHTELFAADGEYKRLYLLQSDLHQMREGT
ncbi:MAG: ABC transporter ATP-binding protein [Clostridia bacterium]|nr:ABC transporter ATP-binding protein [Clostridia bacterium]